MSNHEDSNSAPGTGPDELPPGVDPRGVPDRRSGHEAFIVTLAVLVALLALIFTLAWIVFHRLQAT